MTILDEAKKHPAFALSAALIAGWGAGLATYEGALRIMKLEAIVSGSYILIKDMHSQYILRSEVQQAIVEKDAFAKQVELLQNKLAKIEVTLTGFQNEKARTNTVATEGAIESTSTTPIVPQEGRLVGAQSELTGTQTSAQKEIPKKQSKAIGSRAVGAVVFNPPSNVRISPNGEILCWVNDPIKINTYGQVSGKGGLWYYTDICGEQRGVIHYSQIEFKYP